MAVNSVTEYLLVSGCQNLFIVMFQGFAINGSEGACDGV